MSHLIFFYGTLMAPFNRPGRIRIDSQLTFKGHGSIGAALFDLGLYPAAVSADNARVRGEVYEMANDAVVLPVLDEIEGYRAAEPDRSLYSRRLTPVTLDDGRIVDAWAYFYTARLEHAERIDSGDYLKYLKGRQG